MDKYDIIIYIVGCVGFLLLAVRRNWGNPKRIIGMIVFAILWPVTIMLIWPRRDRFSEILRLRGRGREAPNDEDQSGSSDCPKS